MLEEMQRLKDEGLVGLTGFTTEDNDPAVYRFIAGGGFDAMQIGYNFLHQHPYDPTRPFGSLIEAKRRGMATVTMRTATSGTFQRWVQLVNPANTFDYTPALIQFVLSNPLVDVALVGMRDIATVEATDPERAKVLKEDMLFSIRQKHQDLLTQLAVSVQGYLALDVIRRNNLELIKGVSLESLLRQRRLSPVEATQIAAEVCRALRDMHDHRLLHLDIKPGNILLGRNGIIKLTDFGLALPMSARHVAEPGRNSGTLPYMPPEPGVAGLVTETDTVPAAATAAAGIVVVSWPAAM